MGFLLSAEFAIPINEAIEMTTADIRDIIFLIIFPFVNILRANYVLKKMYSQQEHIYIIRNILMNLIY